MYLCIDVHYSETSTVAAAVLFKEIDSDSVEKEYILKTGRAEDYTPGDFYKRELPVLVMLLRDVKYQLQAIFIDGYVWLSTDLRPGLGAHLFRALDETVPVIGVAKSAFRDFPAAAKVLRGASTKPLYVTAAGMKNEEAAAMVGKMHGLYRLPTLLKYVDRLSRRS